MKAIKIMALWVSGFAKGGAAHLFSFSKTWEKDHPPNIAWIERMVGWIISRIIVSGLLEARKTGIVAHIAKSRGADFLAGLPFTKGHSRPWCEF
jgi:hypothetical protein